MSFVYLSIIQACLCKVQSFKLACARLNHSSLPVQGSIIQACLCKIQSFKLACARLNHSSLPVQGSIIQACLCKVQLFKPACARFNHSSLHVQGSITQACLCKAQSLKLACERFNHSSFPVQAFILVNLVMSTASIRLLTTVCCVIYSLATLAVVVAPNLPVFFTVCVVKYIAQGGVLVPSLTLVGLYFERRRALATSLSLLGISVATVMVPPAITYLRREYGFRGCFLLLSAYEMQAVVAAMLLRPVANRLDKRSRDTDKVTTHYISSGHPTEDVHTGLLTDSGKKKSMNLSSNDSSLMNNVGEQVENHQLLHPPVDTNLKQKNAALEMIRLKNMSYLQISSDFDFQKTQTVALNNQGSTCDIGTGSKNCNKFVKILKTALDVSLLKNYLAILFLITFGLNHSGVFVATYLPSHAIRSGLSPPDAALLMTISGSCDALSRVAYGYLADMNIVRPSRILATACLVLGVACQFTHLYTNMASFSFLAVCYGCCGMAHLSLNTPLIVDLLGLDKLGKVLALGALASSSFISAQFPLHGVLIEVTHSFTASFHWIGITFIVSSVFLWLEPLVRNLQQNRASNSLSSPHN
ncbi:hypothetical protein Btru_023613 [Bulinus truncatus]|nr:hypothetical protein Btru_023613 [Bulinus truncatus]